jgi:hypothetical protein
MNAARPSQFNRIITHTMNIKPSKHIHQSKTNLFSLCMALVTYVDLRDIGANCHAALNVFDERQFNAFLTVDRAQQKSMVSHLICENSDEQAASGSAID